MTKKKPGEFEGLTPASQIKLATYGLCNVALNATEGGIPARLFAQCMLDTAIGILVHENAGDSARTALEAAVAAVRAGRHKGLDISKWTTPGLVTSRGLDRAEAANDPGAGT